MRVRCRWPVLFGLQFMIVPLLHAQAAHPSVDHPTLVSRSLRPVPSRFALAIGTLRERPFLGVQVRGLAYLSPEGRPLSLRAEAYAGWTPRQEARIPELISEAPSDTRVMNRQWWELGGAVAAIIHARPKSSVSPYAIVGYRVSHRWFHANDEVRDGTGRSLSAVSTTQLRGEIGLGFGLRVKMGGQLLRLEVIGHQGQLGLSVGMSIPF